MKNKIKILGKKLELASIAITYAETGEWKTAESYLEKIEHLNKSRNRKMLVVTPDSGFLPETVEYTLNLAERMQFDVLAINVASGKSAKLLQSATDQEKSDVMNKKVFQSLFEKAGERRINCEAIIARCDFRALIKKVIKQLQQVNLIVVQLQKDQELSFGVSIPVYKILPMGLNK